MHRAGTFAALCLSCSLLAAPARADAPTILVDGSVVHTDVPAIQVGGRVFVPLRGVFERFGAAVDFDARHGIAIARRANVTVKVAVDTPDAWVNGRHVTLDAAAREMGGRIEVPLRFVAQALGVSVDYDSLTNTVVIVSGFKQGNFVAAGPGTPAALPSVVSAANAQSPGAAPSLEEERPSPNSLIGSGYPQIYARFSGGSSSVDPSSVRVVVDGTDVTSYSTVSSAYISYTPSAPLASGSHSVEVSGQTIDGAPFDEQWAFRVDTGVSATYVASSIGFAPSTFGIPRFGFFPPGFSVFAPGPQFFFEDEPIIIVFFSPFFNGNGFFTVSGFPGQFQMTPWLGCPGFFWSTFTVPAGILDPDAIVAAHFSTTDGRKVLVHSTAPLRIDGTRKAFPGDLRFAVRAQLVNHPATPRMLVAFHHVGSVHVMPVTRLQPIAGGSVPISRRSPIGRVTLPVSVRSTVPISIRRPAVIPIVHPAPRPIIIMPAPAPMPVPARPVIIPIIHAPQPQPVTVPLKPIPH